MTDFEAALEQAERVQLIADLKAAREVLATQGRCTGEFVREDRVCALGAVGVATVPGFLAMTREEQSAAVFCGRRPSRAEKALCERLDVDYVWLFNDDHRTSDQDVLDLFDKTLADLGGLA